LKLTWLKDLDNDSLSIKSVDALVDLGVLAAPDLLDDLIVVLGPNSQSFR
jgi:hypothetical protein